MPDEPDSLARLFQGNYTMRRSTLIIPCFNEESRFPVEPFLQSVHESHGPDLILVDDGSRDGTRSVLNRVAEQCPTRIQVLPLSRNQGKAEAVRQGCLWAFSRGAETVGYWDADLATPLSELTRFREALNRQPSLELVIGSRIPLLGHAIHKDPLRHGMGRIIAGSIAWVLGHGVYDTQCGAKLFRNSPAMRAVFATPFLTRWLFDVEILARLIVMSRTKQVPSLEKIVLELPLLRWDHIGGSKVKPSDFFKAFVDLARIHKHTLGQHAAFPISESPSIGWRPAA